MSYEIPKDENGLPDIRAMGSQKHPGRHNIGMSAQAAQDYLELKLQLLELGAIVDLSDSAMVELLVFCATHGLKATRVLFSDWRPLTRDTRKASKLPATNKEAQRQTDRINETIRKRKEYTRERLEFFRAYPEAARERKRALCQRARVRDLNKRDSVRRRAGGLPDHGDSE